VILDYLTKTYNAFGIVSLFLGENQCRSQVTFRACNGRPSGRSMSYRYWYRLQFDTLKVFTSPGSFVQLQNKTNYLSYWWFNVVLFYGGRVSIIIPLSFFIAIG